MHCDPRAIEECYVFIEFRSFEFLLEIPNSNSYEVNKLVK